MINENHTYLPIPGKESCYDYLQRCYKNISADIGDYVASIYSSSPEGMKLAASAWKEYVSLAQKWYAYAPKGDAETYAAKIQAVDPSYELPKKAGCISFSNSKN